MMLSSIGGSRIFRRRTGLQGRVDAARSSSDHHWRRFMMLLLRLLQLYLLHFLSLLMYWFCRCCCSCRCYTCPFCRCRLYMFMLLRRRFFLRQTCRWTTQQRSFCTWNRGEWKIYLANKSDFEKVEIIKFLCCNRFLNFCRNRFTKHGFLMVWNQKMGSVGLKQVLKVPKHMWLKVPKHVGSSKTCG